MTRSLLNVASRRFALLCLSVCFLEAAYARFLSVNEAPAFEKNGPAYLVIDSDPGCDDAAALLMTLGMGKFKILGVTTTFGNARIDDTTRNALDLLYVYGHGEIPVYRGIGRTSSPTGLDPPDWIHGENGVGDVDLPPARRQVEDQSAAEYIVDVCNKYPGQVTLAFVGPLRNLADAIKLDPDLPSKWAQLVVMGGAFHVPGNIPPSFNAEANFAGDYVAASEIFKVAKNVVAVGLDVTNNCPFTNEDLDDIREANDKAEVFADLYAFYQDAYNTNNPEIGGAPPHDAIAILSLVHPDLFVWETGTIEVNGEQGEHQGQSTISTEDISRNHKVARTGDFRAIVEAVKSYIVDPVEQDDGF